MAYGDLKVRNLIWNTGSGDNTVVLSTLLTGNSPAWTGTATGVNLTLSGDLTVNGTTTTINTTTLQVEDKNIEIGKVSSPSDTTADGGGWTLLGSTNKTFNWLNATDSWTSSEHIEIASGKNLKVDGTTFFVDGTNNRVGIKTTSPVSSLNINVDSESNLGSGSDGIRLTSASMNAQFIRLGSSYNNGSVTGPGTLLYSSNKLSIYTRRGRASLRSLQTFGLKSIYSK